MGRGGTMKAVVTGICGQDGSFLAEHLVEKGYEVHGVVRRYSSPNYANIRGLLDKDAIFLHEGDLADYQSLADVVRTVKPDEVYNLAAQSHVGTSFAQPELTMDVTGLGAVRVFQAVREHYPRARVYQASSSECYGNSQPTNGHGKFTERDRFVPASPYGAAKVLAHHMAHVYRRAYGLHISCGILFNHESERRGHLFLTRKVTLGLARMWHGLQAELALGNLEAVRDWGYAPEFVQVMPKMLAQDEPDDYVIATGVGHTVQHWVDAAVDWYRKNVYDLCEPRIVASKLEKRPFDVEHLVGNPGKASRLLRWAPKVSFEGLVAKMARYDFDLVKAEVPIVR